MDVNTWISAAGLDVIDPLIVYTLVRQQDRPEPVRHWCVFENAV